MTRETFGLFDTPANRAEIRFGLLATAGQFVAFVVILAWHGIPVGEVNAFIPIVDTAMCVGELFIALKLYAQAAIFRSRALTILASGFSAGALLIIPHLLTFPGAFSPNGLLGAGVNSTFWLGTLIGLSFPIAVILYGLVKPTDLAGNDEGGFRSARVLVGLACAVALTILATVWATLGHDYVPHIFINHSEVNFVNLTIANTVIIVLTVAAMIVLFRQSRSVLDMWLLVALAGWLFQWVASIPVAGRFTLGWYGLFLLQSVSRFVVFIALIAETNRLYAQLTVWAAARERERENRMMSMDAVAAALSHEVGQPLTSLNLSASAGLNHLTREKPDAQKAVQCFHETLDDVNRAFEVLKSIRSTFRGGQGAMREFDLNELVRGTVAILAGEIAARKVVLHLAFDGTLPRIVAHRVQIQRVLINLLNNAIESFATARRVGRRIEIRSSTTGSDAVLIEISDTGGGIASDQMADIFDPFFTTKSAGTGLGLSLSSTIAQEHGGRLWASHREGGGATFHLQLRRDPRSEN